MTPEEQAKSRWRQLLSWIAGIPKWVPVITLISGGGVVVVKVAAPAGSNKPASTVKASTSTGTTTSPTTSTGTTTQPSSPHETRFLDKTTIEVNESETGNFGTGLGIIAGQAFPDSIRQIYATCCSKNRFETFNVPEGFTHFQASIGLETGGIYKAEHSPSITFEVDVGSASNRASDSIMVYNEQAEKIDVNVAGQRQIVLETRIDNPNVCEFEVCHADAVWGNARFTK